MLLSWDHLSGKTWHLTLQKQCFSEGHKILIHHTQGICRSFKDLKANVLDALQNITRIICAQSIHYRFNSTVHILSVLMSTVGLQDTSPLTSSCSFLILAIDSVRPSIVNLNSIRYWTFYSVGLKLQSIKGYLQISWYWTASKKNQPIYKHWLLP